MPPQPGDISKRRSGDRNKAAIIWLAGWLGGWRRTRRLAVVAEMARHQTEIMQCGAESGFWRKWPLWRNINRLKIWRGYLEKTIDK